MKKNYECPILSVLRFDVQDTLTIDGDSGYDLPGNMSTIEGAEEW